MANVVIMQNILKGKELILKIDTKLVGFEPGTNGDLIYPINRAI